MTTDGATAAKKTYSTLEISRICHVDPVTVARWCDQGEIKCFRTPGGHRRVLLPDLIDFLRRQGIPPPPELRAGPRRVLVVDGDADSVHSLKNQLKEAAPELEVDGSSSFVEALLKIGTEVPEAVILDVQLPRVDGLELCRRLRENPKTSSVRVIAITATLDRRRSEAIVEAGAVACLSKPVRPADLLSLLSARAAR